MPTATARPTVRSIVEGQVFALQEDHGLDYGEIGALAAPLAGVPKDAMKKLVEATESLAPRIGLKKARTSQARLPSGYAQAVLATALALQKGQHRVVAMYDTADGCAFDARVPNRLFSAGGELSIQLHDEGADGVRLEIGCTIIGQRVDFGNGRRVMDRLVADALANLARIEPARARPPKADADGWLPADDAPANPRRGRAGPER